MIYELRVYHIVPGRMEAIHKRFSETTLDLFVKHGINVLDFWEVAEDNKLYYVVEFENREVRDAAWASFTHDPDWINCKEASEASGKIVEKLESIFMTRVPYWPHEA